jgi:hypothetical protein
MNLSRLTTSTWKKEFNKRKSQGQTTEPPVAPNERNEIIDAVLIDVQDICALLNATTTATAQLVAKLRQDLRSIDTNA